MQTKRFAAVAGAAPFARLSKKGRARHAPAPRKKLLRLSLADADDFIGTAFIFWG